MRERSCLHGQQLSRESGGVGVRGVAGWACITGARASGLPGRLATAPQTLRSGQVQHPRSHPGPAVGRSPGMAGPWLHGLFGAQAPLSCAVVTGRGLVPSSSVRLYLLSPNQGKLQGGEPEPRRGESKVAAHTLRPASRALPARGSVLAAGKTSARRSRWHRGAAHTRDVPERLPPLRSPFLFI